MKEIKRRLKLVWHILKKTPKNTPPYEYLHRRKVKMRPRRKYRFKLQEAN